MQLSDPLTTGEGRDKCPGAIEAILISQRLLDPNYHISLTCFPQTLINYAYPRIAEPFPFRHSIQSGYGSAISIHELPLWKRTATGIHYQRPAGSL